MNIILTNDDGIKAPGLRALVRHLPKEHRVIVVAPASEKSACSHSITLGDKLRVEENSDEGILEYKVHGTPADCIKFALSELKEFRPELIISGINQGANTGVSVYYSGTISAAREGLINRVPSVAVSLCSRSHVNFESSVRVTHQIVEGYKAGIFPRDILLNVNVPPVDRNKLKGVRITKQAASHFIEEFVPEKQHDGKRIYSLAGEIELYDPDGTSDEEAVKEGFISVTPLKLDLTDYDAMRVLEKWSERGLE